MEWPHPVLNPSGLIRSLALCSPEEPETAALAVIGLILGGMAPGGDLLGPPPAPQTVVHRLAALYAQWHDEWTRFGLTSAEFARIRQISTQCAAPQVDVPNPAWGRTAVLRQAAYAVDRPGAVGTECDGVVHLPTWADPDLAPEIARIHLEGAVISHKPPVVDRLSGRTLAFASPV